MTARGARGGLANGADINAAALADQELGSTRAKAVALDKGPVCGADLDRPVGVTCGARIVGAAERTAAGAQRCIRGCPREAQAEAKVAAVTAAPVFALGFAQEFAPTSLKCSLNRSLPS